ncbi:zinc ribbon domain-containing protein, partial [Candidatus Gracilibacteria bacterium]|nr:zinc ribbon domain-containing protein [Candidatus Gracilibacteria bacterium]
MLLRSIFLIILFLYSIQFFTFSVNLDVMNSFIHGVNLIFHEAGHVIFMPFGKFMTILGGSLFQCMLPAILVGVFL